MKLVNLAVDALNRLAAPHRVGLVSSVVLFLAAAVFVFNMATANELETVFGPQLGADWASFYIAGTILSTESPSRLYDIGLQEKLYHDLFPKAPEETVLPYPGAPFLAPFFRPLAALPYEWSLLCWSIILLFVFCLGFNLTWRATSGLSEMNQMESLKVALSFAPFILDGWLGGQLSGLAILFFGLAIWLQSQKKDLLGGSALSLCLYKPTLLILCLPMLAFSRRFKMLAGFFLGALAVSALSLVAVGADGCLAYFRFLLFYGEAKVLTPDIFQAWKYIDLASFLRPIFAGSNLAVGAAHAILGVSIFAISARFWWRAGKQWRSLSGLAWASALVLTPVLSPHFAIYDASLLVVAAVVAGEALLKQKKIRLPSGFRALLVVVYLAAFISQPLAKLSGVQIITLAIAGLGAYIIVNAKNSIAEE